MQEGGKNVYENVTKAPAKQEEKGNYRAKKGGMAAVKKPDEWQKATKTAPAFPLGGRYPSAHTGGNEGAILRKAADRRPLIRHGLYRPRHLPPKGKAGATSQPLRNQPAVYNDCRRANGRFVKRPYKENR